MFWWVWNKGGFEIIKFLEYWNILKFYGIKRYFKSNNFKFWDPLWIWPNLGVLMFDMTHVHDTIFYGLQLVLSEFRVQSQILDFSNLFEQYIWILIT